MSLGIEGHLEIVRKALEQPSWPARLGLTRARRRLSIPYPAGWYALYRGPDQASIDFAAPVGIAMPGATTITEFTGTHPSDTDTYVYCVLGVGPTGHETPPHSTAYYEIDYVNGVRAMPPPAPPVSFAVEPHQNGQALFAVTVDPSLGRVPPAVLRCYHDGGLGGAVDYETQVGPDVPVSSTGRQVLRFVIDPSLSHGTRVGWSVRAVSGDDVEETNETVQYATVDSEGPPALAEFVVEEAGA